MLVNGVKTGASQDDGRKHCIIRLVGFSRLRYSFVFSHTLSRCFFTCTAPGGRARLGYKHTLLEQLRPQGSCPFDTACVVGFLKHFSGAFQVNRTKMNKFYIVTIECVKHVLGARLPTKEIPVYLCVRRYDEGATGRNEGRQVAHVTTPMAHASLALAGVSSSMIRYPCCCSGSPGSLVMIVFALSGRALGLPVQVSLSAVPGARAGRGKEDRLPVCMCVCTVLWQLIEQGGRGPMSL